MNTTLYSRQRNVHVTIFINAHVYRNDCLLQYVFLFMHLKIFSTQSVKISGLILKNNL